MSLGIILLGIAVINGTIQNWAQGKMLATLRMDIVELQFRMMQIEDGQE